MSRITQLDCRTLNYFDPIIRKKWDLPGNYTKVMNRNAPVIFFGCYSVLAKRAIMNHKALVVIIWAGGDSLRLIEDREFVDYCKLYSDRVIHFAHSWWIQKDLEFYGIGYIDKVILPQDLDGYQFSDKVEDGIYHYTAPDKKRQWYYGTDIIKPLRDRWNNKKMPKIHITNVDGYKGQELIDLYEKCYIGVRLTEHDNMALSCIELGLMGRPSIFNGNIPGAIPYPVKEYYPTKALHKGRVFEVEGFEQGVIKEMLEFREPSRELAEEMREFIYDDEKWLDTKYYD